MHGPKIEEKGSFAGFLNTWMHGPKIEEKVPFGHWADISIGFWTKNRSAKRIFEEKGLFGHWVGLLRGLLEWNEGHWADISIGFWTKNRREGSFRSLSGREAIIFINLIELKPKIEEKGLFGHWVGLLRGLLECMDPKSKRRAFSVTERARSYNFYK